MAKNIFIAATGKDLGKSTISFALIDTLMRAGHKVGFMKPVGQRWLPSPWGKVEEDVILMKNIFQFDESPSDMNPVVIEHGFTENYLSRVLKPNLEKDIINGYNEVAADKDFVIIEGTGHSGVGSVIGKSNADVARILDAKVIMIVKGGVGSTIDQLELNRLFFEQHGVRVSGIIVNKVLDSKIDKISKILQDYCKSNKLKFYGIIPFSPILSHPTLGQIIDELHPEILHEVSERKTVIDEFIVGASTVEEFVEFIREKSGNLMVIFPSRRLDIIFAITNLNKFLDREKTRIHTIMFSGHEKPSALAIETLKSENVNILWKKGDTFSVISDLSTISIKTRPEDSYKIEEIRHIVSQNLDLKNIVANLPQIRISYQFRSRFMTWLQKVLPFLFKKR